MSPEEHAEQIVKVCKWQPQSYWDLLESHEGPVKHLNAAIVLAVKSRRIVRRMSANGWVFIAHPFPGVDIDAAHRRAAQ